MSVYASNRKILGLAGMVAKEVIFVHGSLLVDSKLDILRQVLNLNKDRPKRRFVQSLVKEVTTIEDELNQRIRVSEVQEALVEAFEREFSSVFAPAELTSEEYKLAHKLFKEKYSKLEWTLATCERCPEKEVHAPFLETLICQWKNEKRM